MWGEGLSLCIQTSLWFMSSFYLLHKRCRTRRQTKRTQQLLRSSYRLQRCRQSWSFSLSGTFILKASPRTCRAPPLHSSTSGGCYSAHPTGVASQSSPAISHPPTGQKWTLGLDADPSPYHTVFSSEHLLYRISFPLIQKALFSLIDNSYVLLQSVEFPD